jgi:hypothetical protein
MLLVLGTAVQDKKNRNLYTLGVRCILGCVSHAAQTGSARVCLYSSHVPCDCTLYLSHCSSSGWCWDTTGGCWDTPSREVKLFTTDKCIMKHRESRAEQWRTNQVEGSTGKVVLEATCITVKRSKTFDNGQVYHKTQRELSRAMKDKPGWRQHWQSHVGGNTHHRQEK